MRTRSLGERFWAKVDKHGPIHPVLGTRCWLWTASLRTAGYGQVGVGGPGVRRIASAHRVSWELHRGPIPDGLNVLHKCDVKPCVNPTHLFLGTLADNNADMIAKGRHVGPRSRWTHCKRGHPIDRVFPSGPRYCKTCRRNRRKVTLPAWRARNSEHVRAKQRIADAKRSPRRHSAAH